MTLGLARCLVPVLVLFCSACAAPNYYYQAVSGHLALMRSRENIDAYLAAAPADDPLAKRLALARDITGWAANALGLGTESSYRTFARTERDAVAWNVVATPEFSLEPKRWCFLVAGCISYRGYFQQEKAEKLARGLAARGMDVAVFPAAAYSTLGWFEDPLLDTVLELPEAYLADTLMHELAHQRIYVKGDTRFNESYATFVGNAGASRWLEQQNRSDEADRWARELEFNAAFQTLLRATRTELAAVYAGAAEPAEKRAHKQRLLNGVKAAYTGLLNEHPGVSDRYGAWIDGGLNNADLVLVATYRGGLCAFRELFEAAGRDFVAFHELAERQSRLDDAERDRWLDRSCGEQGP